MPTENENRVENLIDVGEADQQETEINLDEKENSNTWINRLNW